MKKKIALTTIACIGIATLIAILALFGLNFTGFVFDLFFTFLTLSGAGILTIASCEMLEKNYKPALISISLIALSSFLVILCFWTKLDNTEIYTKFTIITSILSICLNLIISNIFKFKKRYLPIQIAAYLFYSITSLLIILLFIEAISVSGIILTLFIILSLATLFILKVLSKKAASEPNLEEYIKITKAEYEDLLSKKIQLENLLKEGRQND
jgi:hypothetical protein